MEFTAMNSKYVSGSNVKLYLRHWPVEADSRIGRVLILHGLGGHGGYYEQLGGHLATRGVEVICYDRRGHGRSDGQRGVVRTIDADLDDLTAVLDCVDHDCSLRWCLLGDSWGALLLLEHIGRHDTAVGHHIVFSSPPIRLNIRLSWTCTISKAVTKLVRNALHGRVLMPAPFPLECASTDPRFLDIVRTDVATNREMNPGAAMLSLRLMYRVKANAARISTSPLVLIGTADRLIDIDAARDFARTTKATTREFSGAQHTLYFDAATPEVADTIAHWLATTQ